MMSMKCAVFCASSQREALAPVLVAKRNSTDPRCPETATAVRSVEFLKNLADIGKYLWDIAGESSDPGGFIDIKLTVDDADLDTAGTIAGEIFYSME